MMGMDDVRPRQSREQQWCDRLRRVSAPPAYGAQRAAPQAAWLKLEEWSSAERDQLALHEGGQRARQLERVAFAPAE